MKMEMFILCWQGKIVAYEHTSHPHNTKNSNPYKFVDDAI